MPKKLDEIDRKLRMMERKIKRSPNKYKPEPHPFAGQGLSMSDGAYVLTTGTIPQISQVGDLVFDTNHDQLQVYTGAGWVPSSTHAITSSTGRVDFNGTAIPVQSVNINYTAPAYDWGAFDGNNGYFT